MCTDKGELGIQTETGHNKNHKKTETEAPAVKMEPTDKQYLLSYCH